MTVKNWLCSLLEKPYFVSQKFICLREMDEMFSNRKSKGRYLNLAIGKALCEVKWLNIEAGQGFILYAIIPANYIFLREFY